jgi:ketosteroid isomerase-like protein
MTAGTLAADVQAITGLICRYPDLIDAGDFEAVADLFAHATMRSGPYEFSGREQLLSLWKDLVHTYEEGRTGTKHLVSNVVVQVDDDRVHATASSSVTVLQARPDFPLQVIATSRHHDSFDKVDGQWRFVERRDATDLVGDMSRHTKTAYDSRNEEGAP